VGGQASEVMANAKGETLSEEPNDELLTAEPKPVQQPSSKKFTLDDSDDSSSSSDSTDSD